GQISYLLVQGHHPSTRNDAFQRHQERAEPAHDSEALVAEAGATKSIDEVKESRLVANAKVALRANAVIKIGSKRRASGATPKPGKNGLKSSICLAITRSPRLDAT